MKPIPAEKPRFHQPPQPIESTELLQELASAASMIMDREECEALLREIEQARRTRILAAA